MNAIHRRQFVKRLGLSAASLPPVLGIRVTPLSGELFARSLRTLDVFVTTLVARTNGKLPPRFVVTAAPR